MIGRVGDGAGVDDAYVGGFTGFRPRMPPRDEGFAECTGLREIEFAT
jgi:hypothetical protein